VVREWRWDTLSCLLADVSLGIVISREDACFMKRAATHLKMGHPSNPQKLDFSKHFKTQRIFAENKIFAERPTTRKPPQARPPKRRLQVEPILFRLRL